MWGHSIRGSVCLRFVPSQIKTDRYLTAKGCRSEGKCGGTRCGGTRWTDYIGNVFTTDGSFNWFIDTKHVGLVAVNAFKGADVRIK